LKTPPLLALALLALTGCGDSYDHVSTTNIEDMVVRVTLKHSHPFLAEYKRSLEIVRLGKSEKKEIFPDTGGYAWVTLAVEQGTLEVRDVGGIQHLARLAGNEGQRKYLGRFDFDARKAYRFIPASEDPREPQWPK
jgi:hypothetical protein